MIFFKHQFVLIIHKLFLRIKVSLALIALALIMIITPIICQTEDKDDKKPRYRRDSDLARPQKRQGPSVLLQPCGLLLNNMSSLPTRAITTLWVVMSLKMLSLKMLPITAQLFHFK